jgi:flagellin
MIVLHIIQKGYPMVLSVNTNVGAMAALQVLTATNNSLATTQQRINTGLNVSSTKDDSSKFTIAQKLRGDLGGLAATTTSLQNAKSTIDVAVNGAEQISDVINKMKALAVQAAENDPNSRDMYQADFKAYQDQITNIIASTNFNGKNLLSGSSATTTNGGDANAIISLWGGSNGATPKPDGTWDLARLSTPNQHLNGTGTAGAPATSGLATMLATGINLKGSTYGATASTAKSRTDTVLKALDDGFKVMQGALSQLGSAARRIDDQITFTSKLSDTLTAGIGNLVDADLARESANLQALQVKQQLGTQALSIANQAPSVLLSLFR